MSEQISNGHKLKSHADIAAKLRPEDATIFVILAEFCMTVAGLGWFQRKAATLIFGAPPESDFNEALEHSLKAAELEMKNKYEGEADEGGVGTLQARSALNCAKCHMQLKNGEEAK